MYPSMHLGRGCVSHHAPEQAGCVSQHALGQGVSVPKFVLRLGYIPACTWAGGVYPSMHLSRQGVYPSMHLGRGCVYPSMYLA